jgi:hypothetical protein
VAFFAEIDAISLLSLCKKKVERFLFFIAAEWTEHPINSPLIAAIGADEIPFSHLFLEQA